MWSIHKIKFSDNGPQESKVHVKKQTPQVGIYKFKKKENVKEEMQVMKIVT